MNLIQTIRKWTLNFCFLSILLGTGLIMPSWVSAEPLKPGTELHYQSYNDSGAETLILIHGMHSSSNTFASVIESFSKQFRVIVYDQRGHGKSLVKGDDYSLPTLAADLLALMDHLHIEKAHLLGHSFGARVALKFSEINPDRVSSLIIEDMEALPRKVNPLDRHLKTVENLKKIPKVFTSKQLALAELTKVYGRDKAKDFVLTKLFQLPNQRFKLNFIPYVASLFGYAANQADLTEALSAVKFPLLVLKAEKSKAVTEEGMKHFAEFAPKCKIVTIENAVHNIHKSMTEKFLAEVTQFYTTIETGQ